jgi:hypothetical protein
MRSYTGGRRWDRCCIIVLGALGVAGCGSATTASGRDGSITDSADAAPESGTPTCSYQEADGGSAAPTHTVVLTYDKRLDFDPSISGGDVPGAVFVDQDGVAVFGMHNVLRVTLDGSFVSRTPNPDNYCYMFAQSPQNYGATCGPATGRQLCIIDHHGQTVGCPRTDPGNTQIGELAWDGAAYSLLYASPGWDYYSLISYDPAGAFVAERSVVLPPQTWGAPPAFVGDMLQFMAGMPREGTSCITQGLVVFTDGLDEAARRIWDLLPDDFVAETNGVMATSGHRTLLVYNGICAQRRPEDPPGRPGCENKYIWPPEPPTVSLYTLVGEDGVPLEPLRRQFPVLLTNAWVGWDGAYFVVLSFGYGGAAHPTLHAIDEDGTIQVLNTPLPLTGQPEDAAMAAVAENDYIVAYRLWDTGETWIARFSLAPL